MSSKLFLSTAAAVMLWVSNAWAADVSLVLFPDRLDCLVKNSDRYLAATDDPLVIFLDLCPRLEPTADELLGSASNSVPGIKKKEGSKLAADSIIALRRQELKCLVDGVKSGEIHPVATKDDKGKEILQLSVPGC